MASESSPTERGGREMGASRFLTFAWWNLHDFAHYDPLRAVHKRWPKEPARYEAKRDRILAAFAELFFDGYPDLLAVCEITYEAAEDLASRLPSGYSIAAPQPRMQFDGFQVVVFFRNGIGLTRELPLIPTDTEDVPQGTRPMIPVHLTIKGHVIRFIACHWTAIDSSNVTRERLADVLKRNVYDFLEPEVPVAGQARHVIVLGDLNEEPMSALFEERLLGMRGRSSTRIRHARDAAVKRIRLYNASWRYLGEQILHGGVERPAVGPAGTCFLPGYGWRTLDHVLVSCGLLTAMPPYLDEARTGVAWTATMVDNDGRSKPFGARSDQGVSDHLPIVGRLVIPQD
jgi:endonuclease/exonuclease/phosphatase family metal-dependent hydrolase